MATADDGVLSTVKSTFSTSSVETKLDDVEGEVENDVQNEASTIAQDVPLPPVLPTSTITDTLGNIGDMLDGDTTTPDGTVIPKGAMVNTACIIFGDFVATFIAYAIVTNITVFGEEFLHYDYDDIEKTSLIVIGIDAGFFLITGCFTDWIGGYSSAMQIYRLICLLGTCMLPFLTFDWSVFGPSYGISIPIRRIFFYTARIVTGLGVCGIQATSPPFAARQIEKYGSASVQSCFHYIYMAVQCAPLLALTGLSFVQLNVSFFCGSLTTVGVAILTILSFKYARTVFRQSAPDKGKAATLILTSAANEIKSRLSACSACCNCSCCTSLCCSVQTVDEESMHLLCECTPPSTSTKGNGVAVDKKSSNQSTTANPSGNASNTSKEKSSTTKPATMTTIYEETDLTVVGLSTTVDPSGNATKDKFSTTYPATKTATYGSTEVTITKLSTTIDPSGNASEDKSSTTDLATTTDGGSELENCLESLPESARHCLWVCYAMLLLSCQVPYSIMRYQISTSYVSQALRMKPTILGQSISPSLLQQCLPLVGIILTPLVNVYIYPYISTKFTTLTMPNRTMVGIALATLSVFSAAIVETARMLFIERGDSFVYEINSQTIVASTLTLDALIPQYVLMGAADVFIFITSLEFAFRQSPCTMQAIATGIFLFYEAIGRIAALLLVPLVNTITAANPWYPHEINDGHLNYYFLVLTAISLTNLVTYCLMEKGYEEVDQYLCPDEETYGGGGGTTSGSSTQTTATANTPISSNPPVALTQPVMPVTSSTSSV